MPQLKANSTLIRLKLLGVSENIIFNMEKDIMIANKLTRYIINNNIILSRGDIINTIIEENRYGNDGKYIWNGDSVDLLVYNIDLRHGSVPPKYIVNDDNFAPAYWSDEIYHNGIFHPSKKYRTEVCETLKLGDEFTEDVMWYGYFLRSGVKHFVFYDFIGFYESDEINKNREQYRSEVKELIMKNAFDIYGDDRYGFNRNFKYNYGERGYFLCYK